MSGNTGSGQLLLKHVLSTYDDGSCDMPEKVLKVRVGKIYLVSSLHDRYLMMQDEARIFLLVDLREFFSDLGSGGQKR